MWENRKCGINIYNPLGNAALSTIAAAVPVVTLLVLIASGKVKAHLAAIIALIVANLITIATMPAQCRFALRCSASWSASFRSAGSCSGLLLSVHGDGAEVGAPPR